MSHFKSLQRAAFKTRARAHVPLVQQVCNVKRVDKKDFSVKNKKSFSEGAAVAEKGVVGSRFATTFEVIVSKIFPAGFCWQASSLVAEGTLGLGAESAGFALVTGVGDACGVFAGHSIYKLIQSGMNPEIQMQTERQVAAWLASAAFLSGTGWQPVVNVCAGMGLGFNGAALVTTGACAGLFFTGLRLGRRVFAVGEANSANFVKDAQLGVAIGGATGAFVGTDVSFAGNWLRPVIGVEETTSDIIGMVKAGSSTSLGFGAFQSVQNVTFPAGSNWTD